MCPYTTPLSSFLLFLFLFLLLSRFLTMPSATTTKRATVDLKMPVKKDGTVDKRYAMPQFVKSDGTRDMRTVRTAARK